MNVGCGLLPVLGQHHFGATQFRTVRVFPVSAILQQLRVIGVCFFRLMDQAASSQSSHESKRR